MAWKIRPANGPILRPFYQGLSELFGNQVSYRSSSPPSWSHYSPIPSSLAWAELYLATALVFRPGGPKLSLYDTDESDVQFARDFVMGFPKHDSRGIRVMVN